MEYSLFTLFKNIKPISICEFSRLFIVRISKKKYIRASYSQQTGLLN